MRASRALTRSIVCAGQIILGGGEQVPDEATPVDSADRLEGKVIKTDWAGQEVIGMSDCLWGLLDGMNEAGLAVSLTVGGRRAVEAPRRMDRSPTNRAAVDATGRLPRLSPHAPISQTDAQFQASRRDRILRDGIRLPSFFGSSPRSSLRQSRESEQAATHVTGTRVFGGRRRRPGTFAQRRPLGPQAEWGVAVGDQ
jgi:hypothetical protein